MKHTTLLAFFCILLSLPVLAEKRPKSPFQITISPNATVSIDHTFRYGGSINFGLMRREKFMTGAEFTWVHDELFGNNIFGFSAYMLAIKEFTNKPIIIGYGGKVGRLEESDAGFMSPTIDIANYFISPVFRFMAGRENFMFNSEANFWIGTSINFQMHAGIIWRISLPMKKSKEQTDTPQ